MKTVFSFFCLLFIVTLFSCENKDPYDDPSTLVLPPITMEGKGTFGCKVNGEVWVPFQDQPGIFTPTFEVNNDGGQIVVVARLSSKIRKVEEKITIKFSCLDFDSCKLNNFSIRYTNFTNIPSCNSYTQTEITDSTLILKYFNSSSKIVSGIFQSNNIVNNCGDSVKISKGRFDIRY